MKEVLSNLRHPNNRRNFLRLGIAGTAFACSGIKVRANSRTLDSMELCGDLSAADPLYLYQSLASQLQPGAVSACRKSETGVEQDLSNKLKELWETSDKLKVKLFGRAKLEAAADRLNTLAYLGHTNAKIIRANLRGNTPDVARAQNKSQQIITDEILRASRDLTQEGEKLLKPDEWELVKKMFGLIDEIKTTYHPRLDSARLAFDKCLKDINKTIFAIQGALLGASTSVVKGNKTEAINQVSIAIGLLERLPSGPESKIIPSVIEDIKRADQDAGPTELTPEQFRLMLEPLKALISGTKPIPRVSGVDTGRVRLTAVAYVTPSAISYANGMVDPMSVREIVKDCFTSGHWLQAMAVTAACLPLWSAYGRTDQRKVLIHSALTAVPRGKSRLWEAAYYLNNLC